MAQSEATIWTASLNTAPEGARVSAFQGTIWNLLSIFGVPGMVKGFGSISMDILLHITIACLAEQHDLAQL